MKARRATRSERGFSFVELLAVVLLLGVLILLAVTNLSETASKRNADLASVQAINKALALYRVKNAGICPANVAAFLAFLADPDYFPDGTPLDPQAETLSTLPYERTYSPSQCRIQMRVPGPPPVEHDTGRAH